MYVSWRNQGLIKEISKLGWGMATPGPNEALLVPRGLEFRCDAKQIDMQLETLIQIQGITFAEVYRCCEYTSFLRTREHSALFYITSS
jgi:hypothetical protein